MKSKDTKKLSEQVERPESDVASSGVDSSKRRLLKGIAITAPVVMAVSSKPALANLCTVSGFLSGNLSNPNSQTYCGGRSPGYWKNHATDDMKTVTFMEVFGGVWQGQKDGYWPTDGSTPSLYEVLKMRGFEDQYQFGAHAVAAYQNALPSTHGYPMSVSDVGDIVSQVLAFGYYTHTGTGKILYAQDVVDFFTLTFDV